MICEWDINDLVGREVFITYVGSMAKRKTKLISVDLPMLRIVNHDDLTLYTCIPVDQIHSISLAE